MSPFLSMRHISKTFPGVKALDDVNLEVDRGEVLALVGENGAGKSTLMKVLTGVYQPDSDKESQILIDGKETDIHDPIHAKNLGISIIYQELATVKNLMVAENIFLGGEPLKKSGLIDTAKMNADAEEVLRSLNMDIKATAVVGDLSVGQQQMIEIAKALSHDSKVIVMDEPTASLSYSETRTLLEMIKNLRKQNIGIIYISHKLEEVCELADRITVLRDGKSVGDLTIEEATEDKIVKMMVDRELSQMYQKDRSYSTAEVVLKVENISEKPNKREKKEATNGVSFELHKGEILGVSGLVGSGRTEIMELLFGLRPFTGKVLIEGQEVKIESPADAIEVGIGFITEDRKEQGLVLSLGVRENFTLTELGRYCKRGFINEKAEKKTCKGYVDTLNIKTPTLEQEVINLSGGNQQKLVIAKWISRNPKILILDEPTRGIDIGAKAEVYALMTHLAQQGMGLIMISSELPEILAMSDRILTVKEGKVSGEFTREEADQAAIMKACAVDHEKGETCSL